MLQNHLGRVLTPITKWKHQMASLGKLPRFATPTKEVASPNLNAV